MKKRKQHHRSQVPEEVVRQRLELARSGAAGVHADQNARKRSGTPFTNRVGSRGAAERAAIADQQ